MEKDDAKGPGRRRRGFERTSSLLAGRIRKAGEARGFAVTRLLTHWDEIAGPEIARIARPVEVSYGRANALGATLVLLTTGAQAPMLEMQKERLREKVNAIYGYGAISRIRLTQTAPVGFAEGQAQFARKEPRRPEPDSALQSRARGAVAEVESPELRDALEKLAKNIFTGPRKPAD